MLRKERLISLGTGLITSGIGIWLKLNANDLSWPDAYSFSGERAHTSWAIKERVYNETGTALMYFGLVLIFMVFMNILWMKKESES